MQKEKKKTREHIDISESNKWFEDMISNLKIDQLLIQSDIIDQEKGEVYRAMIERDDDFVHGYARKTSSFYFIRNLVDSYVAELINRSVKLSKLAFELMNSKVLVWAEINDDDEKAERELILSSAKVNNEFSQYGFHISSTIVEKSDRLNVPNHYTELAIEK